MISGYSCRYSPSAVFGFSEISPEIVIKLYLPSNLHACSSLSPSLLSMILLLFSYTLPHRLCGHVPHAFLRFPSFFWSNSDDPSPCLSTSSISVTPVNSPGFRWDH